MWCGVCGRRRLLTRRPDSPGTICFRCPGCHPDPHKTDCEYSLANATFARLAAFHRRPRALLGQAFVWGQRYFRQALTDRVIPCSNCDRPARVHVEQAEDMARLLSSSQLILVQCDACGSSVNSSFAGLTFSLPQVQQFWRDHDRIRRLPPREVEVSGQAAIVSSFESATGPARLDVIAHRQSLAVVAIHGAHAGSQG